MPTLTLPPARRGPTAPHRSFWLEQALEAEPDDGRSPPLDGDVGCDVCIVGGGYTGLWTALELLDRAPGTDIRLLEADVCGAGASGANGGYLMNLWMKLARLTAIAPTDEAVWLARNAEDAVADVLALIERQRLDVGLRRGPWLWSATNPAQVGAWRGTIAALERVGANALRELTAEEAGRLTGAEHHYGGVVSDNAATLQPARLARGLRRLALDAGVHVHERSPVHAVESGARTTVRTARGVVRCDRVVLAVNAWAAALEGIGRHLVMVASDNFVTEPVPEALRELGWHSDAAGVDSRRRLDYYRKTPDERVLFGKGGVGVGYGARGAATMWGPAPRLEEMRARFARLFPRLAATPVAASWTAPVEYSVTSLPWAGWLKTVPTACYVTGYSGDGVGPSRLMSRIVASLVLSEQDELARCALTRRPEARLPPEPLRFLGAQAVVPALRSVEERADLGKRAPWLVRRVASIDPTVYLG
jgi:glycine/D-amino acid oxidase-like deaminating enzyme